MNGLEPLDDLEVRVLGVLIEKSLATPEHYPLTLNALVAGCNQKSNRDPEMMVSEAEARLTIDGLRMKQLAGISHPAGGRVERYTHAAAERLGLPKPSLAVLAELLLRGPQAKGELRSRASRMAPVPTQEDLAAILERLREKRLALELPPAPGSRAPRTAHTLGAESHAPAPAPAAPSGPPGLQITRPASEPAPAPPTEDLTARVQALEDEVSSLRRQLSGLAEKLGEPLDG